MRSEGDETRSVILSEARAAGEVEGPLGGRQRQHDLANTVGVPCRPASRPWGPDMAPFTCE